MIFTAMEVPGISRKVTVDACVVEGTNGVLAVQRIVCLDGDRVYFALHMPTGAKLGHHAYDEAANAAAALQNTWNALDKLSRELLASSDYEAIYSNERLKDTFGLFFVTGAENYVEEIEEQ